MERLLGGMSFFLFHLLCDSLMFSLVYTHGLYTCSLVQFQKTWLTDGLLKQEKLL